MFIGMFIMFNECVILCYECVHGFVLHDIHGKPFFTWKYWGHHVPLSLNTGWFWIIIVFQPNIMRFIRDVLNNITVSLSKVSTTQRPTMIHQIIVISPIDICIRLDMIQQCIQFLVSFPHLLLIRMKVFEKEKSFHPLNGCHRALKSNNKLVNN